MVQRNTIITVLSVFMIAILLIFLFLTQKADWQQKNRYLKSQVDSLLRQSESLSYSLEKEIIEENISDSLRERKVYDNYFDAYDAQNFRLYALYKDTEQRYSSASSLARAFNIENTESIKGSRVLGEMWYIVPIKGVHFVEENQTWTTIARKYYHNLNDSSLIKSFNKELKSNRFIVIPFN